MLPVEIVPVPGGALVLRARGSELLILSHHVSSLKKKTVPKDFTSYFINEALLNRPARKLFEAWLRKDDTLWRRMYHSIQNDVEITDDAAEVSAPAKPAAKAPVKDKEHDKIEPTKKAKESEKPAAKSAPKSAAPAKIEKKVAAKTKDTKKEAKPAKKVVAKASDKKKAAPAKAKPAAKKKAVKKK